MEKDEYNGGSARDANCIVSHKVASQPEMSNRMKQLLHGVRLSMAAEHLNPADDLDELARRLDAARNLRRTTIGN